MSKWCVMILLALGAGPVHADWPAFRGSTGQGLYSGPELLVHWAPSTHRAWKVALPGKGWSSPAIRDGRIYLTTAVPIPGGQSLRALALNSKDGTIIWNVEVFQQPEKSAEIHAKNSHASPTPIVTADRIFVHFGHQGTACLNLDGTPRWVNRDLTYDSKHGNGGSPALPENRLYFSGDGTDRQFVAALDTDTGRVVWNVDRRIDKTRTYHFAFGTPLIIEAAGRTQVISQGSGVACSYDAKSGAEIWRVRYEGWSVIPRPVFGHGLVYICTGFVRGRLLAVRPDGTGDVTDSHVAWTLDRSVPNTPSPLLVGSELFLVSDNGVASCIDAKSGRVHWQERIGGNHSASPLHAHGRIYCQSEEGQGIVLSAGKKFQLLARNDMKERTLASLAADQGALFLRTESSLYKFEK